jgi:hypothetical protein
VVVSAFRKASERHCSGRWMHRFGVPALDAERERIALSYPTSLGVSAGPWPCQAPSAVPSRPLG